MNTSIFKPFKWKQQALPSEVGNVICPEGINIKDLAVAIDGMTIWACPGNTMPHIIYKSTNGGVTWEAIHIENPKSTVINADLVAIAPDNSNYVAICDKNNLTIYFSANGGITWVDLGVPRKNPIAVINDIAISSTIMGLQHIAIAGQDKNHEGNIWCYTLGSKVGTWRSINTKNKIINKNTRDSENVTSNLAVAFSPNFVVDYMMLVVTANNTKKTIELHVFSFNTVLWDSAVHANYPVVLNTLDKPISEMSHASIVLDPSYFGGDEIFQIAFIGIDSGGTHADGIYRILGDTVKQINSEKRIFSIAWDGLTLVAGQTDSPNIISSPNSLSPTPFFSHSSTYKTSGISKYKNPGGTRNTIVALAGVVFVACTSGQMSAFANSTDNGASFNDISLINTNLINIEDMAVSKDGKIIYLVSDDKINTSIWRCDDGSWKRVLSLTGVYNFLVRTNPNDPNLVYIISTLTNDIYFSTNGGLGRWNRRYSPAVAVDFAVENDNTAYICWGKNVQKTTTRCLTWLPPVNPLIQGGEAYTINCISEGNIIVGGTTGYVSYSNDGNKTWNPITKIITPQATNVQVTASGLNTDEYIFAAVANKPGVWRWKVGQTEKESWYNLDTVGIPKTGSGIVIHNNILYVSSSDGAIRKCTSPTEVLPQAFENIPTGTLVFSKQPSTLRTSATSLFLIKLWAIDTITMRLYSYDDTLVPTKTRIINIEERETKNKKVNFKVSTFKPTHRFPYDVVMSYASEDITFPESLASILRSRGIRVYFDKYFETELWGKDLDQQFNVIFQEYALFCLIFISKSYFKKNWSILEFKAARARAIKEPNKEYILPIKLDDTDISNILPNVKWIDVRKTSVEEITGMIINKLKNYQD